MEVASVLGGLAILYGWHVEVHHFESILQNASRDTFGPGSSLEVGVHQLLDVHEGGQPKRRHDSVLVQHVLPPLQLLSQFHQEVS